MWRTHHTSTAVLKDKVVNKLHVLVNQLFLYTHRVAVEDDDEGLVEDVR